MAFPFRINYSISNNRFNGTVLWSCLQLLFYYFKTVFYIHFKTIVNQQNKSVVKYYQHKASFWNISYYFLSNCPCFCSLADVVIFIGRNLTTDTTRTHLPRYVLCDTSRLSENHSFEIELTICSDIYLSKYNFDICLIIVL